MNRLTLWLVLTGCALAPAARADSIWQRHNFYRSFFRVDTRARRPGDIVTVVIVENNDIENQDQRDLKKNTDTGGGLSLKGATTGTSQGANRTAQIGDLQNADLTQVVIGMQEQQNLLQSTLYSTSRILSLSLLDFIK
jgi:flagellar basal body L-ring protein FlgH